MLLSYMLIEDMAEDSEDKERLDDATLRGKNFHSFSAVAG